MTSCPIFAATGFAAPPKPVLTSRFILCLTAITTFCGSPDCAVPSRAMKRQQETMALQRKAGVNPLSGCIPALIQMPVFFALFRFFPANIDIRHKGFLWADDLSAYDEVLQLPFKIPFYGDHVSLFPILASVAIFFYMQMTQSQQMNMQQPTQEGMPDMQKMMKMMMWFSPIMMMFFFNSYASSLSLYYFVSNLLTIIIMLVIKHFIIDEDKIHAQIQENKKKPEKKKECFSLET